MEQKEAIVVPAEDFAAFDEYAAWTDNVAQYPPIAEPFYLALGIADELGEFTLAANEQDSLAEAGDVLWYCARYATKVLKVPFSEVISDSRHSSNRFAMGNVGIICGIEKKRIRDGNEWSEDKRLEKEAKAYTALCCIIAWLAFPPFKKPVNLVQAINYNRIKLSGRLDAGTIKGDGDHR